MTYGKGEYSITVTRFEQLEKRPGLYIGSGNQLLKCASFGNEHKAELFCEWLEYFFGNKPAPQKLNIWEDKNDSE